MVVAVMHEHVHQRARQQEGIRQEAEHVGAVCETLRAQGLREKVMIDCSHGNSQKNHLRQLDVAGSVATQVAGGSSRIFGVMIESHLVEGRQTYVPGASSVYGQSITDACISLEQTAPLLESLASAQQRRR